VIDPVLDYSVFLHGRGSDIGYGVAVDDQGNAYVTGATSSDDFPTLGGVQPNVLHGAVDAFITKLNAADGSLVYSTYLGGSVGRGGGGLVYDCLAVQQLPVATQIARGIAVDHQGNACVVGQTSATDFPVTPGAWLDHLPDSVLGSAFVTKL